MQIKVTDTKFGTQQVHCFGKQKNISTIWPIIWKDVLAKFPAYFEEPHWDQKLCLQNHRHFFTTLVYLCVSAINHCLFKYNGFVLRIVLVPVLVVICLVIVFLSSLLKYTYTVTFFIGNINICLFSCFVNTYVPQNHQKSFTFLASWFVSLIWIQAEYLRLKYWNVENLSHHSSLDVEIWIFCTLKLQRTVMNIFQILSTFLSTPELPNQCLLRRGVISKKRENSSTMSELGLTPPRIIQTFLNFRLIWKMLTPLSDQFQTFLHLKTYWWRKTPRPYKDWHFERVI